ncbi:MAG: hypothetical protein EPO21_05090 [Chloroflexota bacterium]|nr:MAG: hypothetical protein EPO21_05090 [Chloroflexota bacterium]
MKICFETVTRQAKFLDPTRGFEPRTVSTEIRRDPLTGEGGRILAFPSRPTPRPDLDALVKLSREIGCPFCPDVIDKVTPIFDPDLIPEGRLHVGEATVLPNLGPYDTYSGLTIITREHFVPMSGFSQAQLVDAFVAGQTYLQRVREKDPTAAYCSINWNYMPPAGSTMVHPHMQPFAGSGQSNRERLLLDSSARYLVENKSVFWLDLVEEEQRQGARFIAQEGSIAWLASFAPRSPKDVMAVFLDRSNLLDITGGEFQTFVDGLRRTMRYFDKLNLYSMNLTLFSAPADAEGFRVHARIVSRAPISPVMTSDRNYFPVLHGESLSTGRPEETAAGLRESWSCGA